jgi:hypothetical protein
LIGQWGEKITAWTVLGIAPTADSAAIRRAYAGRLKLTRPDEDPEGFQRLLRARDAALDEAAAINDLRAGEVEPDRKQEDAPPVAAAGAVHADPTAAAGAATAPPAEETAALEADRPPILVREIGAPEPAPPPAPVPRIVVAEVDDAPTSPAPSAPHGAGFSLEARERHWATARRLAAQVTALVATGRPQFGEIVRIVGASADLPRGPRQEVEAAFIEATGRHLRLPDGRFDAVRVAQVRTIFFHGERAFGWLRDDKLIYAILGARDAAAFCLIGQEEDRWASGTPRLLDSDARILFAGSPKYMRVYDGLRQRGRLAWRFDVVVFLVPSLWAYYYHQTALAYATLAVLSTAGVLMTIAGTFGDPYNLAGAGIFVAASAAVALLADRFVMWQAARTVRRARQELNYDANRRTDFLRQNAPARESGPFLMFLILSSGFLMLPYTAAYERLREAAVALWAWLGW